MGFSHVSFPPLSYFTTKQASHCLLVVRKDSKMAASRVYVCFFVFLLHHFVKYRLFPAYLRRCISLAESSVKMGVVETTLTLRTVRNRREGPTLKNGAKMHTDEQRLIFHSR